MVMKGTDAAKHPSSGAGDLEAEHSMHVIEYLRRFRRARGCVQAFGILRMFRVGGQDL